MIIETNVNGRRVTAIAVPEIDRSELPYVRDGLFDMLTTCLSSEENKESVHSESLYFVCLLLKTLAEDIDDNNEVTRIGIHEEEKKGGEV